MEINNGPYNYKMIFENNYYIHSVNLTKIIIIFKDKDKLINKTIFLSTGHSFSELCYISNFGCKITKTTNLLDLFTTNLDLFYSVDNNFNDFCLISFGSYDILPNNYFNFLNKKFIVSAICTNISIKDLENDIIMKNGYNTGCAFVQALIDFDQDKYIFTNNKYYTFKINGSIIIISSQYASGLVVKSRENIITKLNGGKITKKESDYLFEYHFINTLKEFTEHDLFKNYKFDNTIKYYWNYYKQDNKLTISTLMGDSGTSFYRLNNDTDVELLGINICSCHMVILKPYNKNNKIDNKLIIGSYYIDEIHKTSQILPINKIKDYIKNKNSSIIDIIV